MFGPMLRHDRRRLHRVEMGELGSQGAQASSDPALGCPEGDALGHGHLLGAVAVEGGQPDGLGLPGRKAIERSPGPGGQV